MTKSRPSKSRGSRSSTPMWARGSDAISPPISAVLDACTLFASAARDTLLRAARMRIYRVYFTEEIWDEVCRNLLGRRKIRGPAHAQHLVSEIRNAFPGSMVEGYAAFIPSMTNHPKDRHVLAAAAAVGARVVTFNLADFPESALQPLGLIAQSPDDSLIDLYSADPDSMISVLREQSAALRNPPMTEQDILDRLARQQVPSFAELMRQHF